MKSCTYNNIKGFQQTTLIDWDGKIASIIFLGGCNFRCGYCHSRDLVLDRDKIEAIPFEEIERFLCEKKEWIDGVVITGGEPTLNEEYIRNITATIKELGYLVKLDTNGSMPKVLKGLIDSGLIDYIAMDIKAPLNKQAYEKAAGVFVNIDDICESKNIIFNSGIDYEFRTTIVPGLIGASDIAEIAKSIAPAKKYCLQQFVPRDLIDPSNFKITPYPAEELQEMVSIASKYLPKVIVRKN